MRGPENCEHLTVERVLEIHASVIGQFGGSHGIRDAGLLESAVNAPQATAFGASPFSDLIEISAAYLYYLCKNHPFVDGNKRVGLTAALTFLWINGIPVDLDSDEWEELVLDVASSKLDRGQTTDRLRRLLAP
jgi:death-on-curing protein